MTPNHRATDAIERAERLRSAGAWALALGSVIGVLAVMTTGLLPQLSPKSTTSIYAGLEATGYMGRLFVPMLGVSAGLVGIGLLLRALANRKLK